jgi:hypothetical protein
MTDCQNSHHCVLHTDGYSIENEAVNKWRVYVEDYLFKKLLTYALIAGQHETCKL